MIIELDSWQLGWTSFVVCVVLPIGTAGLAAVRSWLRARRLHAQADAARRMAEEESATLDVGDEVLRGDVAYAPQHDFAVRASVTQTGTEAESSGSWTVTWTESARVTEVAPFYVVHASGQRVRVEPAPGRTALAADLVTVVRESTDKRRRVAQLAEGDDVWVTGRLDRGHDPAVAGSYRESTGWIMRAGHEPMTVSRVAPEARLRRLARVNGVLSWAMLLTFALMMGVHTEYFALLFHGRPAVATVTSKSESSDDDSTTYYLHVKVADGAASFDDAWAVTSATYSAASEGTTCAAFASFDVVRTSIPGGSAQAMFAPSVATLIVFLVVLLIGRWRAGKRTWWEGERVIDSVSGRLTD